jgi:hypothetical protein
MEDKNIKSYLDNMAKQLGGSYTEYSDDTVIVTLSLNEGRFQSVKGLITEKENGHMLFFTSTICRLHEHPEVDFRKMLEYNFKLDYARITITDEDYLEVMAGIKYELCTPDEVKQMVMEVARAADKLEYQITGTDVH